MKPRLGTAVTVEKQGNSVRLYLPDADRIVVWTELVPELIGLLDGLRTEAEIINIASTQMGMSTEQLAKVLDELKALSVLVDASGGEPWPTEWARYERQLRFWQDAGADPVACQRRLRAATACIVGAGGGGSHIAMGLAAAGIGRLIIIDPDVVEPSNLNRQIYFAPGSMGRPKAEALCEHLQAFNPDVEVKPVILRVAAPSDLQLVAHGCDLLINAADEPDPRTISRIVSEVGMRLSIPHMTGGGYRQNTCFLSLTVLPKRTPCFSCMRLAMGDFGQWETIRRPDSAGVLGSVATVAANLHVMEALRVLTEYEPPTFTGKWVRLNLASLEKREERFGPHPLCHWCNQ